MSELQFTWLFHGGSSAAAQPLLVIENLTVQVGLRRVLEGVDLTICTGDHLKITGPNGCGKSTLLNAIAGIEPARIQRGRILFRGVEITAWPAYERAKKGISYMRQVDNIFPALTVRENLVLALGRGGYESFVAAFPDWTAGLEQTKKAGQLSGGQRKKLAWAMAVLGEGRVMLADEPQAGVSENFSPPTSKTYILVTHQ